MEKEKICSFCKKIINLENEKYTLLGTYNGSSVMDESYFHFDCFSKWYNSKVKEKAENTLKHATQKISSLFGGMKKMAMAQTNSGFNSEQAYDMQSEIPDMKQEIPELKSLTEILHPKKEEQKRCKKKK